ncbi:hypothetical protein IFM53868_07043 [Aspergillus udagawae]|uniref:Uncharacterized protein n=1 Tax=Aspergillus udagawae TaxID=91492 RepID=A0ABQ1B3D2_9EURO|nr:hypothetical protein IFM53868_07043 [Aspergillus udagawae]
MESCLQLDRYLARSRLPSQRIKVALYCCQLLQDIVAADGGGPDHPGVCPRSLTPKTIPVTQQLFPDVNSAQIPAFFADSKYTLPNGTKFMDISPESTVFAIIIGGNDIGAHAFLTDSEATGKTLPDYVDCVFEQLTVYTETARVTSLSTSLRAMYLAPQYAMPEAGGLAASQYWLDKHSNTTAVSQRMLQQVATVNAIYDPRTPLEVMYKKMCPGASFTVVNLEGLLNGTAPFNVTGYLNHCTLNGTDCVRIDNNNLDAFMLYDELHPSEQTWRMISCIKDFVKVIKCNS